MEAPFLWEGGVHVDEERSYSTSLPARVTRTGGQDGPRDHQGDGPAPRPGATWRTSSTSFPNDCWRGPRPGELELLGRPDALPRRGVDHQAGRATQRGEPRADGAAQPDRE